VTAAVLCITLIDASGTSCSVKRGDPDFIYINGGMGLFGEVTQVMGGAVARKLQGDASAQ
jgi:hypothetical protein